MSILDHQIKKFFKSGPTDKLKEEWDKIYRYLKKDGKYTTVLDNDTYHAMPGVSSTQLREFSFYGPEAFGYYINSDRPKEQTKAMEFGQIAHEIMLFNRAYEDNSSMIRMAMAQGYKHPKASSFYKEWAKEKEGENKYVLSGEQANGITMWKKVIDNSPIKTAFTHNTTNIEHSYFALDKNGLLLKCKPDLYYKKTNTVIDLKTTAIRNRIDNGQFIWNKEVEKYGHHIQQAHYVRVLKNFTESEIKFIFLRLLKTSPFNVDLCYCSKVHEEDAEAIVNSTVDEIAKYFKSEETGGIDVTNIFPKMRVFVS